MYIGKNGQQICEINLKSANQSVCLTGMSGTGKTTRLNQMELQCAKEGAGVIVLDLHQTHVTERIFPELREEYEKFSNRINAVQDGLGLNLLMPRRNAYGSEDFVSHINSVVMALSSSLRLGERQRAALRKSVIWAVGNATKFSSEAEALIYGLHYLDDAVAQAVLEKLWGLLYCGALRPSCRRMYAGRINIIELSGLDEMTQVGLAEVILADIWRNTQFANVERTEMRTVLVLDEFQNMPLGRTAVLPKLLREGRKYGLDLLLATQTLTIFPKEVLALINQTATQLYFHPTVNEAGKIARLIDYSEQKKWQTVLQSLGVGECIAVGELNVNGVDIQHPLILR